MQARVPVLMYHSIDDGGSVVSISRDAFARQMRWLHDQAFNVMPLSSLAECLVDRKPMPSRSAVIRIPGDGVLWQEQRLAWPAIDRPTTAPAQLATGAGDVRVRDCVRITHCHASPIGSAATSICGARDH
jgi:hypothetical protein